MASTTFTVRVESGMKKRLERLAKSTGRSRSFIAAEAINEYLDVNEWQVSGIKRAIVSLLSNHPEMGRAGRVPGTRELVIPNTPFIVPYRLEGNRIQILRIFHGSRRWPERF